MALVIGSPRPETLRGGTGLDLILGFGGADLIAGGAGDDAILGGAGSDTIGGDNLPKAAEGEADAFGPLPASFGGQPGNNLILAGAGDDLVLAGFGADLVLGGEGADTLHGYGSFAPAPRPDTDPIHADGPDTLLGGAGHDLIRGGGGDDWLLGGEGADTLVGGVGLDRLIGGEGPDVFVFGRFLEPGLLTAQFRTDSGTGPGNRDLVVDFTQGEDLLDLSAYRNLLARPTLPREPIFLGTGEFEPRFVPQIRYRQEEGETILEVFAPLGSPPLSSFVPPLPILPSAEIALAGLFHLTEADLILVR